MKTEYLILIIRVIVFSSNVFIIQEAHFGVKNTKSKDFWTYLLKPYCKDFFYCFLKKSKRRRNLHKIRTLKKFGQFFGPTYWQTDIQALWFIGKFQVTLPKIYLSVSSLINCHNCIKKAAFLDPHAFCMQCACGCATVE